METLRTRSNKLKLIVVAAVCMILTTAFPTAQAFSSTPVKVAASYDGVTREEVCDYLRSRGIRYLTVDPISGSLDWLSVNADNTMTKVYVVGNQIVGHENIDI